MQTDKNDIKINKLEDKTSRQTKDIYLDSEKDRWVSRMSDKQNVTILCRAEANKNKDCINIWMEIDQSAHCMSFTSPVNVFHQCDATNFYFACLNYYLNA